MRGEVGREREGRLEGRNIEGYMCVHVCCVMRYVVLRGMYRGNAVLFRVHIVL